MCLKRCIYVILRGIEKRRNADDSKDRSNFVSRTGEIASDIEKFLKVPALPRKNLHLTNPTESTISTVGTSSDTTKAARCLNAALRLFCLHWVGEGIRRIKGFVSISDVRATIEEKYSNDKELNSAAKKYLTNILCESL